MLLLGLLIATKSPPFYTKHQWVPLAEQPVRHDLLMFVLFIPVLLEAAQAFIYSFPVSVHLTGFPLAPPRSNQYLLILSQIF